MSTERRAVQMIEPILLAAACIYTFDQQRSLTNASGFFFARDDRLFLATSRHVVVDEASNHFPDRLEIELHIDPDNLAESTGFSIPLYRDGRSIWRQGRDRAGEIDVTVIELDRSALPKTTVYRAFTPQHLSGPNDRPEVGTSLLVVGFPLGFHDTLHHLPVVRHAGDRLFVRPALQGRELLPHRCAHASRDQRRAGRDARCRAEFAAKRPAVDAARRPLVAARRRFA